MADERMIPGQSGWRDYGLTHLQRYQFALERVRACRTLDLACGAGFGAFVLSQTALHCRGIDLSAEAIGYAQTHYRRANLDYRVGDALALAEQPGYFDAVVSFETIEHLPDPRAFAAALHCALRPGGRLVLSAPNTLQFARAARHPRPNEFHLSEPTHAELTEWLSPWFQIEEEWEQSPVLPALLRSLHDEHADDLVRRRLKLRRLVAAFGGGLDQMEHGARRLLGKALPAVAPEEPPDTVVLHRTEIFPLLPERQAACQQFLFVCRRRDEPPAPGAA